MTLSGRPSSTTTCGGARTPPSTNPKGDTVAKHLLTGIAHCGRCRGRMRRTENRGSPSYNCNWCYRVSRLITRTDDSVTRKLLALLEQAPHRDDAPDPAAAEATAQATSLRARLDALVDQAADGGLTAALLARAEQKLLPQIRAAEQPARELSTPPALTGYDLTDIRTVSDGMDVSSGASWSAAPSPSPSSPPTPAAAPGTTPSSRSPPTGPDAERRRRVFADSARAPVGRG